MELIDRTVEILFSSSGNDTDSFLGLYICLVARKAGVRVKLGSRGVGDSDHRA